ncbi:MAG: DNA-binding protein [Frankiales bacterium]|nr:DNA-binding protein [Frankiales bacterium]
MGHLLAQAVRASAGAVDRDDVLHRVARVLLSRADWVLADRLDEPDLVTRVVALAAEGELPGVPGLGTASDRRSSAGSIGLLPRLALAPSGVLHLDEATLVALTGDPDPRAAGQAAGALALGAREVLLLALRGHGTVVGVLVLGSHDGFSPEVVAELTDVAVHTGLAVDAARLAVSHRAVATALQTSLLPPVPALPGLALAARYSPAAHDLEVGGDWYDAFPGPSGLVVVVGDVEGHDLAAAAQMADLRNLLRALAVDRDEPPSALLGRLDRTAAALGLSISATCVVGVLSPADPSGARTLTWSSAGHLPPLLLAPDGAQLLETDADLMLGVQPGSVRLDHSRVLLPGETLVLFTDGLVEHRGEALDAGLEELRQAAAASAGLDPDALAEQLLRRSEGADDDVALLVVRLLGG